MTASAAFRWTAEPSLTWTRFPDGDEWVAYHPLAGTVHCVTDSAHQVWELASEQPRSFAELAALLAGRFEQLSSDELEGTLRETLMSMDQTGLVQAVL